MVHYDSRGEVAHHVRYQLDRLRPAADRLVFVTAGQLTAAARAALADVDRVIERENVGYDFGSWRAGLLATPDWPDHDRLILTNDSYVGPLVPVADLLADADRKQSDAYGITTSDQELPHIQSYFAAYSRSVLARPDVQRFWRDMAPAADRDAAIEQGELGLARLLRDVPPASYFVPTAHELRLIPARIASHHRQGVSRRLAGAAAYGLQPIRRVVDSPVLALWDRALPDARLPAVKVSLFTQDPYRIDRGAALARFTERFPDAFAGFADYLEALMR